MLLAGFDTDPAEPYNANIVVSAWAWRRPAFIAGSTHGAISS